MLQLKKISKESIPAALEKAERYRLINESWQAESICLDILEADPQNNKAIITLILAITDQFGTAALVDANQAKQLLSRLSNEYERLYYTGIISERQGTTILSQERVNGGFIAYDWLTDAMEQYERAEAIRPSGNDDTILRWNTCARLIKRHRLELKVEEYIEPPLE